MVALRAWWGSCGLTRVLIHRSTWKWNSANFAITEFYEVQAKKSPRGNLSAGEDILPDRTIRLRRERGREPTEGLAGETTGATRNDTYGTQRVHAKQGCWLGKRLAYESDAHGGYSPLDYGCGAWRVLLALAGTYLHRLVRDLPLSGGGAQHCRKLAAAPTQVHQAPPRHRAHLPGGIGGPALGSGVLRGRAC